MRSLSAASESSILALPQQSVSKLILKRPKALNALNSDMISLLTNHVSALQSSEICKTIVLMSSPGDRAFCAGGDVKSIPQLPLV